MCIRGRLYLVPTPIGNLKDITLRAIEVLKEVDLILAEDTRTTSHLLTHYQITKPLSPYHQHNEHKVLHHLVSQLLEGKKMAVVTDAGTPGISDPAFLLVRECIKVGVKVECLPGATAFVPALVNSCLLYTSDAADERSSVDLGGRRIIKKKKNNGTARRARKSDINQAMYNT